MDLTNQNGFGESNMQDLQNLMKAIEAGNTTGRETTNSLSNGAALKVESLERTLANLTFEEKHCKIWKMIPKESAFNTVEEYNELVSYGNSGGAFTAEGETPMEADSQYRRRAQLVKFMGTTGIVSHPMTLVNTMTGDQVALEVQNRTKWLMQQANRALYSADEAIVPHEFNGLLSQHAKNDAYTSLDAYASSQEVIDARGASLTEAMINLACNNIAENFGYATTMFAPPKVLSKFNENFYGNKFIVPNSPSQTDGTMGQRNTKFASQFGDIEFVDDIMFNKAAPVLNTQVAENANCPNAPTADPTTPVAAVAPTDASSRFAAGDAGTYFYAVRAVNRFGKSAITVLSNSAVTVAAGGAVSLKFTATASTIPGTGFEILRSAKGAASSATTYFPLFRISNANLTAGYDGGAAGIVRDRNRKLNNTNEAFVVEWSNEVCKFKQLAPLMKMDLAIIGPAYRFMLLLYGTPILRVPKRLVRIVNLAE